MDQCHLDVGHFKDEAPLVFYFLVECLCSWRFGVEVCGICSGGFGGWRH
jgi:hypothetical protein